MAGGPPVAWMLVRCSRTDVHVCRGGHRQNIMWHMFHVRYPSRRWTQIWIYARSAQADPGSGSCVEHSPYCMLCSKLKCAGVDNISFSSSVLSHRGSFTPSLFIPPIGTRLIHVVDRVVSPVGFIMIRGSSLLLEIMHRLSDRITFHVVSLVLSVPPGSGTTFHLYIISASCLAGSPRSSVLLDV